MAASLLIYGMSAWIGKGALWMAAMSIGVNAQLGTVMAPVALVHIGLVASEGLCGWHWSGRQLMRSCGWRALASAGQLCSWGYALFFFLSVPLAHDVISLGWHAVFFLPLACVCFVVNLRTYVVLDPSRPTVRLEQTLVMKREKLRSASVQNFSGRG